VYREITRTLGVLALGCALSAIALLTGSAALAVGARAPAGSVLYDANVLSVSCASAGNCAAGGVYLDQFGNDYAFVASQRGGTWGDAVEVRGTDIRASGNDARVTAVSCGSAGNCGAVGTYEDAAGIGQVFVVSEKDGSWGKAAEIPGTAAVNKGRQGAWIGSVSCAPAGNCAAGGNYTTAASQPKTFVVTEKNGTWGNIAPVRGDADGTVDSVSCASAGNCTAAGIDQTGSSLGLFAVSQKNGTWGTAQAIRGADDAATLGVDSVSCGSAGNCGGAGVAHGQGFLFSQKNGTVGPARAVPGGGALGFEPEVTSVSCRSAGNCGAGGYYESRDGIEALVVSEKDGTWGQAAEVPGSAALNRGGNAEIYSVSCGSPGNCTAAGSYLTVNRHFQAFIATEKSGTWGAMAEVPGTRILNYGKDAQVNSVSCPSAGNCSAGGFYHSLRFAECHQPFVVSEMNGTWGQAEQLPGTTVQKGCQPST
jgi:hypothetical protein